MTKTDIVDAVRKMHATWELYMAHPTQDNWVMTSIVFDLVIESFEKFEAERLKVEARS